MLMKMLRDIKRYVSKNVKGKNEHEKEMWEQEPSEKEGNNFALILKEGCHCVTRSAWIPRN